MVSQLCELEYVSSSRLPGKSFCHRYQVMHVSRKLCQRGSNFDNFFLVDEGRKDSNTTISGPSSARQRYAIKMTFRRRVYDSPTSNAGLVAFGFLGDQDKYFIGNPIFRDFLDPRMHIIELSTVHVRIRGRLFKLSTWLEYLSQKLV